MRPFILFLIAFTLFPNSLFAISTGRNRVTAASAHFEITVDATKKDVLTDAAAWLENAYNIESKFFDYDTPEKTQVVLLDEEDFSNGFAYAANQWVVIYLPPSRFQLRGSSDWLANVSAHELSHILTLRKMGLTSKFQGIESFVSWGRSKGTADADAAWIPHDAPPWLAEGLAQYGSMHCGFDTLDSHREMLLKEAWNSGNLLPLKAMEAYSQDSRSSEMIYNQGFHLVDFLYRVYGRDSMNFMMALWPSKGYASAFTSAFGATPDEIYARWRKELDVRFTNAQARPEAVSLFEPPYKVEDAPVYDSALQTLYYLSSADGDFGATHLYARNRNGQVRMIQRDVNTPIHLAPDGSLLYPVERLDAGTGARIDDLYRYHPKTGVKRETRNLRIVAAIATKSNEVYAILRSSGRTAIARLAGGWPVDEVTAPAGMEFTDLTAGFDGTLYVSAVQSNNSDILRFDIPSKSLHPLLGSKHNERDPFFWKGRLYFSSDPDGSYAIYSLKGKTISRHTPAGGQSAFAPFTDGTTLRYSVYTPHGFLLRSQPLDSGDASAELGQPSNSPLQPPPPANPYFFGYDRTGLEFVSYSALLGYAHTLHEDFFDEVLDATIRYNPCSNQAYAGGAGYWADPEGRNVLLTSGILGLCTETSSSAYVPNADVQYWNFNFTPDLFLRAAYQSVQLNLPDIHVSPFGLEQLTILNAGAVFHISDYVYDIPQIQLLNQYLDLNYGPFPPGRGNETVLENTLGFSVADHGADFINQGILGNADAQIRTKAEISYYQANLELHTNVYRLVFLEARGHVLKGVSSLYDDYNDAQGTLAADLRIPEGLTVGSVDNRGLFLESVILHAALSGENSNGGPGFSLTQSAAAIPGHPFQGANAASPGFLYSPAIPVSQMLELGVRLKTITPSSRVALWNFSWQAPPDDISGGYFSISISL